MSDEGAVNRIGGRHRGDGNQEPQHEHALQRPTAPSSLGIASVLSGASGSSAAPPSSTAASSFGAEQQAGTLAASSSGAGVNGASSESAPVFPSKALPLPKHIAVVMDGNGRWAKERGEPRLHGHRAGARSVRLMVEQCRKWGVRYLTLFSFSTENWNRSADEVFGLMALFKEHLEAELKDGELLRNGVRLHAIGDRTRLPLPVRQLLAKVERYTESNDELHLVLAVSYGGREDIVNGARRLAEQVKKGTIRPEEITVERMSSTLWTAGIPDPDLLIRTGGEMRLSNFLLWQSAYTELVVIPEYWPEFSEAIFERCLGEFQERERRFGLTSEQLRALEGNRK